eukprot:scaffold50536_cov66-Phaeocystis_antarctica.AAC.8
MLPTTRLSSLSSAHTAVQPSRHRLATACLRISASVSSKAPRSPVIIAVGVRPGGPGGDSRDGVDALGAPGASGAVSPLSTASTSRSRRCFHTRREARPEARLPPCPS